MSFSVLMSIYLKENPDYFNDAMTSIWDDQVLKPDEIVLVQDGGLTDELYKTIAQWENVLGNHLVIVDLEENVGFAKALNRGLEYCNNELIARMDTDDIAMPKRFERQYEYMRSEKDIAVCGTYIEEFDQNDSSYCNVVKLPLGGDELKKFAILRSPICHPSSMFRKSVIVKNGSYPELRLGQDYALWSVLLARGYKLSNIPEVLLKLRTNSDFFKRRGWESFKYEVKAMQIQYREGFIGLSTFTGAVTLRAILRLSPVFLKKIAYKALRR